MAVDMGKEIDAQNRQIDRINAKVILYYISVISVKFFQFLIVMLCFAIDDRDNFFCRRKREFPVTRFSCARVRIEKFKSF